MLQWCIVFCFIGTTYSVFVDHSPYNYDLVPEEPVQHTHVNPAPLHMVQVPALATDNRGIVTHIPSQQHMFIPARSPAMGYHVPTHISTPPTHHQLHHGATFILQSATGLHDSAVSLPDQVVGHQSLNLVPSHGSTPPTRHQSAGFLTHVTHHGPTYILQSARGLHDPAASFPDKIVGHQSMEMVPEDDLVKKVGVKSSRKKVKAEISKVRNLSDRSDSSMTANHRATTRGHSHRVSPPHSPFTRHVTHIGPTYILQSHSSAKQSHNGQADRDLELVEQEDDENLKKGKSKKAMPRLKHKNKRQRRPHHKAVDHDDIEYKIP